MSVLDDFSIVDDWGPEKIVCVSDPRTGMRGVLVIDTTARGIGKGGTRMSPTMTVTDIARLARVMTWKWASAGLFFGGAKAGIRADPHAPNKERVLRAFVRKLANEVPREYVFGLDMGLTENDAAVIQDEVGDRSGVVGTPAELGGVPYDLWGLTGFGVAEAADAARDNGLAGARVVIQGLGSVGAAVARRASELGAIVTAVSTATGALHDPRGLDIELLLAAREQYGDDLIRQMATARTPRLTPGEELVLDCDVLVPAATQDTIGEDLARDVRCQLIVEGANLAITPAAQTHLASRDVTVIPDLVANAGGVIAAAYAMDARHSAFPVDRNQILAAVSEKLRANTRIVLDEAHSAGRTPHAAAQSLAQQRVASAMHLQGRLPAAWNET